VDMVRMWILNRSHHLTSSNQSQNQTREVDLILAKVAAGNNLYHSWQKAGEPIRWSEMRKAYYRALRTGAVQLHLESHGEDAASIPYGELPRANTSALRADYIGGLQPRRTE